MNLLDVELLTVNMNLLDVELLTERLLLKPLSIKHKSDVFLEFNEAITKYMYPRSPKYIFETEIFINESIADLKNGNNLGLVILRKESQEFLGCAGLHAIKGKDPELGIWLKTAAHGHKYGLEAITAIKTWADANLDYESLRYPVDQANIASRKIPEALDGKILREYNKTNMSGKTLHIVEYRIYRTQ